MEELKSDTVEEKEEPIDFGLFLEFEDINSLPRSFCTKLFEHCTKAEKRVEQLEELLQEDISNLQVETELVYFNISNRARLMTAVLHDNEGEPAVHMPDFEKYRPLVDDEFFIFI